MKKQTLLAGTVITLIVAFAVAASWYQGAEAERVETLADESTSVLVPHHAMTLGPADAKVTLVEFFDPACETCALFHGPVKELLEQHPERVRLVLRYAPFHHGSEDVAKMLEAARRQGKYWEALEVMFATQRRWASHHNPQPELLWELLPAAGRGARHGAHAAGRRRLRDRLHRPERHRRRGDPGDPQDAWLPRERSPR